ncbi:MAG: gliding motility lipoprotein GldD [Flavobacteriia bacterium]|nr:MAG: gliding motility lipoprotein GldD [Flavobacteriia bacterium]
MYTNFRILIFGSLLILLFSNTSCKEDTLPKPKAQLRLEYKEAEYRDLNSNCPYIFQISTQATSKSNSKCWVNINYPKLNASINITYRPINNNLKELFREAEKLTFNHAIKADGISSVPFENKVNKTYGAIYEVTGNAASPLQFHLTDSTKNFITGAVYFNVEPNYDSIVPAVKYLEKDVKHLMETLKWRN